MHILRSGTTYERCEPGELIVEELRKSKNERAQDAYPAQRMYRELVYATILLRNTS